MRTRTRVLGEQLNPLLIVLPLAMLGSAVLCDFGGLSSRVDFFARVGFWDMGAGLLAGLVTVGMLVFDLIPASDRYRRILGVQIAVVALMLLLFLLVWAQRVTDDPVGNAGLLVVEAFALVVGAVAAWLGRGFVGGEDGEDGADIATSPTVRFGPSWFVAPTGEVFILTNSARPLARPATVRGSTSAGVGSGSATPGVGALASSSGSFRTTNC